MVEQSSENTVTVRVDKLRRVSITARTMVIISWLVPLWLAVAIVHFGGIPILYAALGVSAGVSPIAYGLYKTRSKLGVKA